MTNQKNLNGSNQGEIGVIIKQQCKICREIKPLNAFLHAKKEKSRRTVCKKCENLRNKMRPGYVKKREKAYKLRRFLKKNDPKRRWVQDAYANLKQRAKRNDLKITLTKEWLYENSPIYCPIFGVRLNYLANGKLGLRASVDRVIPNKGYTPENCQVVSFRANSIKSDATVQELQMIVKYLKKLGAKHG